MNLIIKCMRHPKGHEGGRQKDFSHAGLIYHARIDFYLYYAIASSLLQRLARYNLRKKYFFKSSKDIII